MRSFTMLIRHAQVAGSQEIISSHFLIRLCLSVYFSCRLTYDLHTALPIPCHDSFMLLQKTIFVMLCCRSFYRSNAPSVMTLYHCKLRVDNLLPLSPRAYPLIQQFPPPSTHNSSPTTPSTSPHPNYSKSPQPQPHPKTPSA